MPTNRHELNLLPVTRTRRHAGIRTVRQFRPLLLALEDRTLLSNTLTVTNAHDSGDGSLRAAVAAAQPGDTIVFSHKLSGQTITLTSRPIVDTGTSLTIQGPGAGKLTVSGNNQSGIFNLVPTDPSQPPFAVSISGLTLANAAGPDSSTPYAINDTNASLTLDQDVIANNHNGGVQVVSTYDTSIPPPAVTVTITRSEFLNNQSDQPGGGLDVSGVVLSVGSSQFVGNASVSPASAFPVGGTIYISGTLATELGGVVSSTIDESLFKDNSALWNGGAIQNNGDPLTITNSSFAGNQAKFGGGALENDWIFGVFSFQPTGSLSVQNSAFSNNQVIGFDSSSSFGASLASGGAIDLSNVREPVSISGSTFTDNSVLGGDGGTGVGGEGAGGAIAENAGSLTQPTTFTVNQSTFTGNQAVGGRGDSGGGLAQGGAVSIQSFVDAAITNSDFESNSAVGGSGGAGEPVPFADNMNLAAFGGALQIIAPLATVSDDSFESNTAQGGNAGPGLSGGTAEGGAINGYYTNLALSDLSFTGNQALGGRGGDAPAGSSASGGSGGQAVGGAVAYFDFFGNEFGGTAATITDLSSSNDKAIGGKGGTGDGTGAGGTGGDALGGGIYNGGFLTVASSHFSGDRARGGDGGDGGATGLGGAGGNGEGGAIGSGVLGAPDDSLSLSVTDSKFNGNRAQGGDGGDGTTDGTDGQGNGGAIAILAGPASITKSKFSGNKASTSGDDISGNYTS